MLTYGKTEFLLTGNTNTGIYKYHEQKLTELDTQQQR